MKLTYKLIAALSLVAIYRVLPSQDFALAIEAFIILIVGIPHGATDHLLFNASRSQKIDSSLSFSFLIPYFGMMIFYGLCWILLPQLSLIFFFIISAYHFGETQWYKQFRTTGIPKLSMYLFYFLWGFSLLSMVFFIFPSQSFFYLHNLVSPQFFESFQSVLPYVASTSLTFWISILLYYKKEKALLPIIEFLILLGIILLTDLLYGFILFFGIWHSTDAIINQVKNLRPYQANFSISDFIKEAIPFTVISMFGIGLLLGGLSYFELKISMVTLFFIAISVLTLPHMWVIERFYRGSV